MAARRVEALSKKDRKLRSAMNQMRPQYEGFQIMKSVSVFFSIIAICFVACSRDLVRIVDICSAADGNNQGYIYRPGSSVAKVIQRAKAEAMRSGYDLSKYAEPEISFHGRAKYWFVTFRGKSAALGDEIYVTIEEGIDEISLSPGM